MKRIYLLALILCGALQIFAQQYKVEYIYDNAGNRISRTVVTISNSRARTTDVEPLEQTFNECKITLYPNPTKGMLNMEINEGDENCNYEVSVFTTNGQKIIGTTQTGNGNISIDLSSYSAGIYI